MVSTTDLQPGDVLLYKGGGIFSRIIQLKTWHPISHVEVYVGDGQSAASRDGKGTGIYTSRLAGLAHVLRPTVPFDLPGAMGVYERELKGLPYGWLDLLQFGGFDVDTRGIVCSPFATTFLRAGGVPVFNDEPAEKVAPFQFLTSELLRLVWDAKAGTVAAV